MKYEQDIINLLVEVGGAGLPLQSIVKHVYNAHNSLFEPIAERSVYQAVRGYLVRNTNNEHSLFLKSEDGKYRVNPKALATMQQLQFTDEEPEEDEVKAADEPLLPFDFL